MVKLELDNPVVVIGAGPVGLAASAHLAASGLEHIVLEKGHSVGASVDQWRHVRLFTPWEYTLDSTACALLESDGWLRPPTGEAPTGDDLIRQYLEPLSNVTPVREALRLNATVTAVVREGHSKISGGAREQHPFVVKWRDKSGEEHWTRASAVIDASGTWDSPNPIGTDGLQVPGEVENAEWIDYGIPDVLGTERALYAGARTLVLGGGHSASNAILDLLSLQEANPETRIVWGTRSGGLDQIQGGGEADKLADRGALGMRAAAAVRSNRIAFHAPFSVTRLRGHRGHLQIDAVSNGEATQLEVDRVIVATGFRPDFSALSEIRLRLDPIVETTPELAPLIDPNLHSCGTVRPHGVDELSHPEPGFFIAGMKSYGRAPTFLLATGYEQVRSIVAELAGDPVAARDVHLDLPETGVCITDRAPALASSCCGSGKAPASKRPAKGGGSACCAGTAGRPG